ncbi:hypothetical protein I79_011117 [Cricetulus griseus]|uniref:Uncharacterized protein n=1 Tax=Cricetulus griseus TaxID=10029 RepID=G3HK99_CRIGR|nr:hypothetical protein I79_011117 [Cricetulus griseus]
MVPLPLGAIFFQTITFHSLAPKGLKSYHNAKKKMHSVQLPPQFHTYSNKATLPNSVIPYELMGANYIQTTTPITN